MRKRWPGLFEVSPPAAAVCPVSSGERHPPEAVLVLRKSMTVCRNDPRSIGMTEEKVVKAEKNENESDIARKLDAYLRPGFSVQSRPKIENLVSSGRNGTADPISACTRVLPILRQ